MTAVEVVADRMTGTVRVKLPRNAMAALLETLVALIVDTDEDAVLDEWITAQERCGLPDRELSDLYDLTRDEADNRLADALDAVLGLLPSTVWTMTRDQANTLRIGLTAAVGGLAMPR